jgi:hypothetical protein
MRTSVFVGVLIASVTTAAAQSPVSTRTGHELNVSAGHYNYIEPGSLAISIHGLRIGGEYTGTLALNRRRNWFAQANLRGSAGHVAYDGWCRPWFITPSSASANGYRLGLGSASPCTESGDGDGHLEARALVGRDVLTRAWGLSPEAGLGIRYLSNGTTGVGGYRTDRYLYVPLGVAARTNVASRHLVTLAAEYDVLLHGWQTTRESRLAGGEVPATPTAPAFIIDGFTDLSFAQHRGWALRARAKYQATRHWSIEPSYIYWNVSASNVSQTTATFTVNGVTARQQLGAIEPVNATHEFLVNLGWHF